MVVVGSPCGILPLPQLLVLQQLAFVRQRRGLGREGAGPDQVAGEREGERVRDRLDQVEREGESRVRSVERVRSDQVERERDRQTETERDRQRQRESG